MDLEAELEEEIAINGIDDTMDEDEDEDDDYVEEVPARDREAEGLGGMSAIKMVADIGGALDDIEEQDAKRNSKMISYDYTCLLTHLFLYSTPHRVPGSRQEGTLQPTPPRIDRLASVLRSGRQKHGDQGHQLPQTRLSDLNC